MSPADGTRIEVNDAVRIDRWLLAARVFKTRTLCATACEGGKVDVNGNAASAHKMIRVGDRVQVTTPAGKRQLVVRGLGIRRLAAADARELYEDVTPPPPPADAERRRFPPPEMRDPGSGRPTKRDRRELQRLRRGR
ncbi:MAG: RNA-binding S4 domain-containing protein [Thermodesulfobacteriota bacterium]